MLATPDRTSIARLRRIPVPEGQLQGTGWVDGQILKAARDDNAVVVTSHGGGRNVRLLAQTLAGSLQSAALVTPAAAFGFETGQVLDWQAFEGGVRISAIDGTTHETYLHPELDQHGLPIPPSWLAQAFTNLPNSTIYLNSGVRTAGSIAERVEEAGEKLEAFEKILDFGCGAGRVLRCLPDKTKATLVGYDLHRPSIDWCRAHMPFGRWEYGVPQSELPEPSESFDLIYAFSVLTHLDEPYQDFWLAEWKRLLKPGGLLIVTYRSEDFVAQFIQPRAAPYADQVQAGLKDKGFIYLADGGWAGVFEDYYNDAFHSHSYVEKKWGAVFEIVRLHRAGTLPDRQDMALLRKRS